MKNFKNIEEALDYAIELEKTAYEYYKNLSEKFTNEDLKEFFKKLSEFEFQHQKKLELIKANKIGKWHFSKFNLLNNEIFSTMKKPEDTASPSLQKAISWAINQEQISINFYLALSKTSEDEKVKKFLLELIEEENNHIKELEHKLNK